MPFGPFITCKLPKLLRFQTSLWEYKCTCLKLLVRKLTTCFSLSELQTDCWTFSALLVCQRSKTKCVAIVLSCRCCTCWIVGGWAIVQHYHNEAILMSRNIQYHRCLWVIVFHWVPRNYGSKRTESEGVAKGQSLFALLEFLGNQWITTCNIFTTSGNLEQY